MHIVISMGFFLPVPALRGGATEKIWHRFAQEFARAGHQVTLISRRWPGLPDRETRDGITHLRLRGCDHTRRLPVNLVLDLWWSLRVLRATPQADVLVSNNVSLPIFARRLRPRAGRVAVVLGRMPKGQTRWYGAVDRVLATSNAVKDKALAENPTLASRCLVMLNPVDCELHGRMNVKPRTGEPLTIGYVGRINPEKNLEALIDAAALLAAIPGLPAWRLVFIGPYDVAAGGGGASYRDALIQRAARSLGPSRLEFAGPVFDAVALAGRYGEIDLFCYPSRAEQGEGLSVAPIEAMAAGAVPIVSSLPCYADLVRHGENGCTFDHRSATPAAALAAQLEPLLRDAALRSRLAARAQADARRFDYATIAARLLNDFQGLVATSR